MDAPEALREALQWSVDLLLGNVAGRLPAKVRRWLLRNYVGSSLTLRPGPDGPLDHFGLTLFFESLPVFPLQEVLFRLPGFGPQIELQVVAVGKVRPLASAAVSVPGAAPAIVMRGDSIGHLDNDGTMRSPGTLGALVRFAGNPQCHMLSNNHVLSLNGEVEPGTDVSSPASDRRAIVATVVRQPDQCRLRRLPHPNKGDYGLAEVREAQRVSAATPGDVEPLRCRKPIRVTPERVAGGNLAVHKRGARTGVTRGVVTGLESTFRMFFNEIDLLCAFRSVILVEPATFAEEGDSGSLVVTSEGEPIGLVFAKTETQVMVCPLDELFEQLNLCFVLPDDCCS